MTIAEINADHAANGVRGASGPMTLLKQGIPLTLLLDLLSPLGPASQAILEAERTSPN